MANATATRNAILDDLNPQQREAVVHGRGPLLIIAGAGTGKTTTLAHRVAHLIATGVDPGRILLLTFTRRAAAEMLRRVEGIVREIGRQRRRSEFRSRRSEVRLRMLKFRTPTSALCPPPSDLPNVARKVWGGTFHAVATRLLRQYGKSIGLPPAFSILDRSDSEDLMHVVRAELGLADNDPKKPGKRKRQDATRFPLKGTCLNIYSRAVNTQRPLKKVLLARLPLVRGARGEAQAVVLGLRRSQGAVGRPRLRRPAAVLAGADEGRRRRGEDSRAVRLRAGR